MSYKKIRIRDDDILVGSKGFAGEEFNRFKGFHNMVMEDQRHFCHVLAILYTEIQNFPQCIEFVKTETAAGRMMPEVHGFEHIDYACLSHNTIVEHLTIAKNFIIDTFDYIPTIWYSPWGAGADERGKHLDYAAKSAGLKLVTCANMIQPQDMVRDVRAVKEGTMTKEALYAKWEGKEILRHWWEGTGALHESIQFFKANF